VAFRHLHVDVDRYPDRTLPPAGICSLAEWTVARLAKPNARNVPKHLLLLGPVSLAVRTPRRPRGMRGLLRMAVLLALSQNSAAFLRREGHLQERYWIAS
jgi:hypothetical protein